MKGGIMKNTLRAGFTIIEIAIVIAVIGILSSIVYVSYAGVQQQVREDTAGTYALQASKKLLSYSTDNGGDYPAALADIGLVDSTNTTYQYTVNNAVNPSTYCVTVTNINKSAYISNGQSEATLGACPGHGVDGQTPPPLAAPANFTVSFQTEGWFCGYTATWTAVPAASSYTLQYDDASDFATPVGTINNVVSGTQLDALAGSRYARLAAVGPSGQGAWTNTFYYSLPGICGA